MNNSMLTNLITKIKSTNFLKNTSTNTYRSNRHVNRPTSIKEIESIVNNHPKQKIPGPDTFTDELYQAFKEEIILIPYNLFNP